MNIREWVSRKQQHVQELQQKIQKEKIEILQKRDQQRREQQQMAKPGTIKYALVHRQSPWDLSKDIIQKRREQRENHK